MSSEHFGQLSTFISSNHRFLPPVLSIVEDGLVTQQQAAVFMIREHYNPKMRNSLSLS
jgi:hypothetical protein